MRFLFLFIALIALSPQFAVADVLRHEGLAAPIAAFEKYRRTELFFGTKKPDGTEVSESEWQRFVDEVITPRFPEGITVFAARGQWRDKADRQVREGSRVVVLIYRNRIRKSADKRIDEIRSEYRTRFNQESVMRLDFSEPVHVRF